MKNAKHIRALTVLLCFGFTSGCGFTPIYGDSGSQYAASDDLKLLEINEITGVSGTERIRQLLRNELDDTFRNSGENAYSLDIRIEESFEPMGIRPDGSASREQYILEAAYTLKDNSSGEITHEGLATARNAYDVVLSDFSNLQAREDSARRGVKEIARSIALRLGLYFSDQDR